MIISENTPESTKSSNPNFPHPDSFTRDPPPSYGAAQSQLPLLQSNAGPSDSHTITSPGRSQGQSPARRFFKAFVVALLIWILFWLFVGTSIEVRSRKPERQSYDIPEDLQLDNCIDGPNINTSRESVVHTSFELPLSSKKLFLISKNMGLQDANLKIFRIISSSDVPEDVVRVDVGIVSNPKSVLPRAKTCRVSRRGGENGVGIFAGLIYSHRDFLLIHVTLTVSKLSGYDTVKIQNFETDLPDFQHYLDSLSDFVEFNQLSLKSSNAIIDAKSIVVHDQCNISTSQAPISIGSLVASYAKVETSNGPITGTYDATGRLLLKTSNAKIEVAVNLASSDHKGVLGMRNSNGRIEADINLISGSGDAQNDYFTTSSITSNGETLLNVKSLPYESSLNLEAKSSNKGIQVKLPDTFEGQFILSTSNAAPVLQRDEHFEKDPTGQGRTRQVVYKSVMKNWRQGNVYWENGHESKSDVKIRSSNAEVMLSI